MMIICSLQLAAEAFTLGVKAGVPTEDLYTAVRTAPMVRARCST